MFFAMFFFVFFFAVMLMVGAGTLIQIVCKVPILAIICAAAIAYMIWHPANVVLWMPQP